MKVNYSTTINFYLIYVIDILFAEAAKVKHNNKSSIAVLCGFLIPL